MATAKGVRFANCKLPTPGSGLDDEDRYSIGGTLLSADSIPLPSTDSARKQRAALARIVWADSTHDDEQDRYTIAGFIQPLDSGSTFLETFDLTYTLTPNFFLGNTYDGSIDVVLNTIASSFIGQFRRIKGRISTKKRLILEIDGQLFHVASQKEADAIIAQVNEFKNDRGPLAIRVHKGIGQRSMPNFKPFKITRSLLGKSKSLLDK